MMRDDSDEYVCNQQPFQIMRRVRWTDCDPGGVAFTGELNHYLIDSVMLFYRHIGWGPESHRDNSSVGMPCKSLGLTFSKTLYMGDELTITVSVGEIRSRTFDLNVAAYLNSGDLAFAGHFSPICIDSSVRQSVAIPAELKRDLLAHQTSTGANS